MPSDEPLRTLLLELRERAAERLETVAEALDALTRARRSENDDDEHDPEGVTLSSEWSRLAGLVGRARAELQRAEGALHRWEAGEYGRCAACGRPIPEARLEARPFAEHCVPCAERLGR
ncbi:TraR/DksA C4-type zinc finger protein [Leucobacter sp. CSA1]|uniref:TraR/DksA C4-type zinc finger protein n=1 Tax=Leucobacter chromiisoli TaxID=2796471 RepID=A0A934Q7N1_9MICO|nr:TraR/DksA C4-type zinc finger protein [Leucobacter chromiisoli]MBK0419198.1 TraR/DksA C4-type zinc finger protein [Leucobacter chromiisoli]